MSASTNTTAPSTLLELETDAHGWTRLASLMPTVTFPNSHFKLSADSLETIQPIQLAVGTDIDRATCTVPAGSIWWLHPQAKTLEFSSETGDFDGQWGAKMSIWEDLYLDPDSTQAVQQSGKGGDTKWFTNWGRWGSKGEPVIHEEE